MLGRFQGITNKVISMPLEPEFNDISDLNPEWPLEEESITYTAFNLRGLKEASQGSFHSLGTAGGTVDATAFEFAQAEGLTSNLQNQIDSVVPWELWNTRLIDYVDNFIYYWNLRAGERLLALEQGVDKYAFVLPDPAVSNDKDTIYVTCTQIEVSSAKYLYLERPAGTAYYWVRLPDGSWAQTFSAECRPGLPSLRPGGPATVGWPAIVCVYVAQEGRWRIWCERGEFNGVIGS